MNITVKSTKVLKTGTGDYGEWKMVGVTTVEGVKYSTFAKEAENIQPGSVINIIDMDEDAKGKSFKKYELARIASPEELTSTSTPNGEMSKDDWIEKDRIKRRSIERQTAIKIAFEPAGSFNVADTLEGTLASAEEIYQWISRPGTTPEPSPTPTKSTQKVTKDESKGNGAVKNRSDFHKLIHGDFGIQPDQSLKILNKKKWDDVSESFEECYSVIKAYHEATK